MRHAEFQGLSKWLVPGYMAIQIQKEKANINIYLKIMLFIISANVPTAL